MNKNQISEYYFEGNKKSVVFGLNKTPLEINVNIISAYISHVGHPYSNFNPTYKYISNENNFFGLYHCVEGFGALRTKEKTFNLKKDDIVFVYYNDIISLTSTSNDWKFISIFFYAEKLPFSLNKVYNVPLLQNEMKNILSIIHLLQTENQWNSAKSNALLQIFLCDILSKTSLQDTPSPYVEKMNELSDYIHKNLNEDLSVANLAKFCTMSKTFFNNIFKQHFKTSPKLYITKVKMEKAATLLINTFLPIEIISNDLMFYSPSHFIHAFKKYYNITPLQYRQKHSKSDKPTKQ